MPTRDPATLPNATQLNEITEIKYAKQRYIDVDNGNTNSRQYLKHYMSTNVIFAISKSEVKDNVSSYAASITGTGPLIPAQAWY